MCISNGLHYKYFIMNSTLLLFNKWLQRFIIMTNATQCTHSYITIITNLVGLLQQIPMSLHFLT